MTIRRDLTGAYNLMDYRLTLVSAVSNVRLIKYYGCYYCIPVTNFHLPYYDFCSHLIP